MQIAIVTIFPQMFASFVCEGMTRRALETGQLQLEFRNPRDFTEDSHRQVDDRPYGGGPGMVMMAEPLNQAIGSARAAVRGRVIYLSPQGRQLKQKRARELASEAGLVLLAGRYEGVDERVLERLGRRRRGLPQRPHLVPQRTGLALHEGARDRPQKVSVDRRIR